MADEQKENKSTGSDRSTGLVLAFPRRNSEPAPTDYQNACDRLDRLGQELRGLRAAYAAALEQLAVTTPDDTLKQAAVRSVAHRIHAGFNAQPVLLDRLLKP